MSDNSKGEHPQRDKADPAFVVPKNNQGEDMTTVTIEEAQAKLPELIEQLVAGERLVITRNEQPGARLRPRRSRNGSLARRATQRAC